MIETYSQIIKNLKKDKFSKIYLLMGEEAFFINKISQFFQKNFINEDHKGFNQEIHYGKETTIESIINSCKSFPMMSDKKLVIVKNGDMSISKMMMCTLSLDHRVIDGALGAKLLSALKNL